MITEPPLFTPEEFMGWFPEFSQNGRAQIERCILESQREYPLSFWGCDRVEVVRYSTAHKLAMNFYQVGQMAGVAVESAKGGTPQLPKTGSVNYDSNLASTFYGQEIVRLKASLPVTGMFT